MTDANMATMGILNVFVSISFLNFREEDNIEQKLSFQTATAITKEQKKKSVARRLENVFAAKDLEDHVVTNACQASTITPIVNIATVHQLEAHQ